MTTDDLKSYPERIKKLINAQKKSERLDHNPLSTLYVKISEELEWRKGPVKDETTDVFADRLLKQKPNETLEEYAKRLEETASTIEHIDNKHYEKVTASLIDIHDKLLKDIDKRRIELSEAKKRHELNKRIKVNLETSISSTKQRYHILTGLNPKDELKKLRDVPEIESVPNLRLHIHELETVLKTAEKKFDKSSKLVQRLEYGFADIGEFGEWSAKIFLSEGGMRNAEGKSIIFKKLLAIKYNIGSDHGLDLVGVVEPSGELYFFEVKASELDREQKLSKRQEDPIWFIRDVLSRTPGSDIQKLLETFNNMIEQRKSPQTYVIQITGVNLTRQTYNKIVINKW